jgi:hypothetical protein
VLEKVCNWSNILEICVEPASSSQGKPSGWCSTREFYNMLLSSS